VFLSIAGGTAQSSLKKINILGRSLEMPEAIDLIDMAISIVVVFVGIRLISAPYFLWKDEVKKRTDVESQNKDILSRKEISERIMKAARDVRGACHTIFYASTDNDKNIFFDKMREVELELMNGVDVLNCTEMRDEVVAFKKACYNLFYFDAKNLIHDSNFKECSDLLDSISEKCGKILSEYSRA
jgi:hypothetical protein